MGHCHLVVGKGGGCGIAHTGRVGAAIMVHVKLLLHVVVSGVVCSKERGGGLVGQVAVGVVWCGPVDALVARVAFSLVGVDAVVGIQLAVGRVAGSIRHGVWQGRDAGGGIKRGRCQSGCGQCCKLGTAQKGPARECQVRAKDRARVGGRDGGVAVNKMRCSRAVVGA